MKREVTPQRITTAPRAGGKTMKTCLYFDYKQFIGEYNEISGYLSVINVYTDEEVNKRYSSKYAAKRGFERIVRKMLTA